MKVLLTDGNERASLAVVRALGMKGYEVIVGAERLPCLASRSKYCRHAFLYASPTADQEGYVKSLLAAINHSRAEVLFPMTDIALNVVISERETFERATRLPLPSNESIGQAIDKGHLVTLAQSVGVPVPETIRVDSATYREVIALVSSFPVIVKPCQSAVRIGHQWRKAGVHVPRNRDELQALFRDVDYLQHPALIQKFIDGEGQAIFGLMDRGKVVALFAHRRIREKPPSGGVSVYRESLPVHPMMAEYAVRLLQHLNWHGVAMVEFRVERSTGVPYLVEINGRFWGSLQLAIDAGLNFPLLLCKVMEGKPVDSAEASYASGIRSRWLLGDLDHLYMTMRGYGVSAGGRWQALKAFCRFGQPNEYLEVLRWDDMKPFWHELSTYFSENLKGKKL